ncbi:E3 ubiquitin-protein ligase DTX3L-like [Brachionichthys hirsutus]|uniref:E3 ubiquitin-protein ligase DTX3L-like n=1 Tax=Brachionichthys hirsutus TaxID=412623 RepID=UPI0036051DBB
MQPAEQSGPGTSPRDAPSVLVPVSHFWYVSHAYRDDMERIEKENGVRIEAEVKVRIEADRTNPGAGKALAEFSSLVRKCAGGSASTEDPLVDAGLTMEGRHWGLLSTSYSERIDQIKEKFAVSFHESGVTGGKVTVKARSRRSDGRRSMESHAVRALLRLCQEAVLPLPRQSAAGLGGESEGAAGGPASDGQSGCGAADADDDCPICKDKISDKKRLQCKHEFCEDCLTQSVRHMGHVCPVCRDVFGVMEGDQPEGQMSGSLDPAPLPGFPDCGTIVIAYWIPTGRQSGKHPNPGTFYPSLYREAYLPDSREGRDVYRLLTRAFQQKLVFTVGASRTTGMDNQVTWNDIHHKTSRSGGAENFGYPDAGYLSRVREELKAKGIE